MKTQYRAIIFWTLILQLGLLSAQHALIRIPHPLPPDIARQLAVDHYLSAGPDSIDWIAGRHEIVILQDQNLGFRILQPDMQGFYQMQLQQSQTRTACGLQNYSTGSMGGYHTYSEVVAEINLMHQLFPSLCGTPDSIGQTFEGRPIYALKLSDEVTLNQSDKEARVYLDALTHAREPLSMESLLAFAWWLLENYGQNETATYLLDNREIYILPVINPDGYVFNEQIAPNGGGLWRKNRNNSQGSNCVGVDLNRNFPFAWGNTSGAASSPCSEIYHGANTASELEVGSVQMMIDTLGASAGFSVHSYGQVLLHPWLWQNESGNFALASELASDFIPANFQAYGNGPEMLNYLASGTTADYMHAQGMLSWTPELGTAFWEPASKICERVTEMRKPLLHICWAAGDFARIQNTNHSPVIPGDTTSLSIRIKNRGIGDTAINVFVNCRSLNPDMEVLDPSVNLGDIAPQNVRTWSALPIRLKIAPNANSLMGLEISVRQGLNAGLSDIDTIYLRPGPSALLFEENFENGRDLWLQQSGDWGITTEDAYQGQNCLSESPNSLNDFPNWTTIELDYLISIPEFGDTELSFWHKYSLAPYKLDVRLQIENGNGNWLNQQTPSMVLYNDSTPVWTGHKYWHQERYDLSAFRGQSIRVRWAFNGSSTNISSDGYYLDEVKIRTYQFPLQVGLEAEPNPPSPIKWLEADGYWPMYIEWQEAKSASLSLSYFDAIGREILSADVGDISSGERLTLPEQSSYKGPMLILIRDGQQLIAQRWVMMLP